jgi:hypothetical protein
MPEPAPPNDGPSRVAEAVRAIDLAGPRAENIAASNLQVTNPIPVYAVGVPSADSNPATLLARAHLVGWRYLVLDGDAAHVADIRADQEPERPHITRGGGLADRLIKSGTYAEALAADGQAFDVRILDANLFGRTVLWLVDRQGGGNRFVSISADPTELDGARFLNELSSAERDKARAFGLTTGEAGG